jgi:hypothetical protein
MAPALLLIQLNSMSKTEVSPTAQSKTDVSEVLYRGLLAVDY